jgi:hypothetical protein
MGAVKHFTIELLYMITMRSLAASLPAKVRSSIVIYTNSSIGNSFL